MGYLIDEGFDLAVRIANLPDSSLVSRHVGDVAACCRQSRLSLKTRLPQNAEDLKSHAGIGQTAMSQIRELRYFKGQPAAHPLPIRFEINDAHACLSAAEHGKGIPCRHVLYGACPSAGRLFQCSNNLGRRLSRKPPYAQRRIVAPKIRAFIDFAAPRLSAALSEGRPILKD